MGTPLLANDCLRDEHRGGSVKLFGNYLADLDPTHVGPGHRLNHIRDRGASEKLLCASVVYLANCQAAEEREWPDGGRGPVAEPRLVRCVTVTAGASAATYCSMTARGIRPRSAT